MAEFHIVIEKDEDGWFVGNVSELPGCHTQGKTIPQLLERMKEAIEVYLGDEKDIHQVKFIGVQKIEA